MGNKFVEMIKKINEYLKNKKIVSKAFNKK